MNDSLMNRVHSDWKIRRPVAFLIRCKKFTALSPGKERVLCSSNLPKTMLLTIGQNDKIEGWIHSWFFEDVLAIVSEFSEVKKLISRNASVFERIFFNDSTFNSIECRDGEGKRNSSYCSYRRS